MSCAACSTRVEKAVSKVPGVTSCSVSLLTNSMGVEGTASQSEIIAAVEAAVDGASVKGADAGAKSKGALMDEDALKDRRGRHKKDYKPQTEEERLKLEVATLKRQLYLSQMEIDVLKKLQELERGNR